MAGNYRHGHARQNAQTPEYRAWAGMWRRCTNPSEESYPLYGGRGIIVCDRWRTFQSFYEDMGPKPTAAHSIDRIDGDGNYTPTNCRWATSSEQARNRKRTIWVVFRGQRMCLKDAAHAAGLRYKTVHARVSKGWAMSRALNTPIGGS